MPVRSLFDLDRDTRRSVSVYPGSMLFIVMQGANSFERDLLHDAIAPLKVFDRPIPSTGSRTDVEMMFTILPIPSFSIPGARLLTNMCDACRWRLKGPSKSSSSFWRSGLRARSLYHGQRSKHSGLVWSSWFSAAEDFCEKIRLSHQSDSMFHTAKPNYRDILSNMDWYLSFLSGVVYGFRWRTELD